MSLSASPVLCCNPRHAKQSLTFGLYLVVERARVESNENHSPGIGSGKVAKVAKVECLIGGC